jgi:hypothetical protein
MRLSAKRAAMSAGEDFGSAAAMAPLPPNVFDVPLPNYHLLVRPDIIQNARQPEQVLFARFHEGPPS